MSGKKKPQVDVWHSSGAHAGWRSDDVESALKKVTEDYGKPNPYELGQWRRGYQTGKANSAIYGIQRMFHDMKTADISTAANTLWQMYKDMQMQTFGEIVVDEHGVVD